MSKREKMTKRTAHTEGRKNGRWWHDIKLKYFSAVPTSALCHSKCLVTVQMPAYLRDRNAMFIVQLMATRAALWHYRRYWLANTV